MRRNPGRARNLKTEVSLRKRIKCFPSSLRPGNLKTQQSGIRHFRFVSRAGNRKIIDNTLS